MTQKIKFFVSYEIKCQAMTAKMILNAGEVQIGFKNICAGDSETIGWKSEGWWLSKVASSLKRTLLSSVYRDLLAITSTSTMVQLSVKFEKPPKLKLHEFIKTTLNFDQLTDNIVDDAVHEVSLTRWTFSNDLLNEFTTDCRPMWTKRYRIHGSWLRSPKRSRVRIFFLVQRRIFQRSFGEA